eukprot:gene8948-6278_t
MKKKSNVVSEPAAVPSARDAPPTPPPVPELVDGPAAADVELPKDIPPLTRLFLSHFTQPRARRAKEPPDGDTARDGPQEGLVDGAAPHEELLEPLTTSTLRHLLQHPDRVLHGALLQLRLRPAAWPAAPELDERIRLGVPPKSLLPLPVDEKDSPVTEEEASVASHTAEPHSHHPFLPSRRAPRSIKRKRCGMKDKGPVTDKTGAPDAVRKEAIGVASALDQDHGSDGPWRAKRPSPLPPPLLADSDSEEHRSSSSGAVEKHRAGAAAEPLELDISAVAKRLFEGDATPEKDATPGKDATPMRMGGLSLLPLGSGSREAAAVVTPPPTGALLLGSPPGTSSSSPPPAAAAATPSPFRAVSDEATALHCSTEHEKEEEKEDGGDDDADGDGHRSLWGEPEAVGLHGINCPTAAALHLIRDFNRRRLGAAGEVVVQETAVLRLPSSRRSTEAPAFVPCGRADALGGRHNPDERASSTHRATRRGSRGGCLGKGSLGMGHEPNSDSSFFTNSSSSSSSSSFSSPMEAHQRGDKNRATSLPAPSAPLPPSRASWCDVVFEHAALHLSIAAAATALNAVQERQGVVSSPPSQHQHGDASRYHSLRLQKLLFPSASHPGTPPRQRGGTMFGVGISAALQSSVLYPPSDPWVDEILSPAAQRQLGLPPAALEEAQPPTRPGGPLAFQREGLLADSLEGCVGSPRDVLAGGEKGRGAADEEGEEDVRRSEAPAPAPTSYAMLLPSMLQLFGGTVLDTQQDHRNGSSTSRRRQSKPYARRSSKVNEDDDDDEGQQAIQLVHRWLVAATRTLQAYDEALQARAGTKPRCDRRRIKSSRRSCHGSVGDGRAAAGRPDSPARTVEPPAVAAAPGPAVDASPGGDLLTPPGAVSTEFLEEGSGSVGTHAVGTPQDPAAANLMMDSPEPMSWTQEHRLVTRHKEEDGQAEERDLEAMESSGREEGEEGEEPPRVVAALLKATPPHPGEGQGGPLSSASSESSSASSSSSPVTPFSCDGVEVVVGDTGLALLNRLATSLLQELGLPPLLHHHGCVDASSTASGGPPPNINTKIPHSKEKQQNNSSSRSNAQQPSVAKNVVHAARETKTRRRHGVASGGQFPPHQHEQAAVSLPVDATPLVVGVLRRYEPPETERPVASMLAQRCRCRCRRRRVPLTLRLVPAAELVVPRSVPEAAEAAPSSPLPDSGATVKSPAVVRLSEQREEVATKPSREDTEKPLGTASATPVTDAGAAASGPLSPPACAAAAQKEVPASSSTAIAHAIVIEVRGDDVLDDCNQDEEEEEEEEEEDGIKDGVAGDEGLARVPPTRRSASSSTSVRPPVPVEEQESVEHTEAPRVVSTAAPKKAKGTEPSLAHHHNNNNNSADPDEGTTIFEGTSRQLWALLLPLASFVHVAGTREEVLRTAHVVAEVLKEQREVSKHGGGASQQQQQQQGVRTRATSPPDVKPSAPGTPRPHPPVASSSVFAEALANTPSGVALTDVGPLGTPSLSLSAGAAAGAARVGATAAGGGNGGKAVAEAHSMFSTPTFVFPFFFTVITYEPPEQQMEDGGGEAPSWTPSSTPRVDPLEKTGKNEEEEELEEEWACRTVIPAFIGVAYETSAISLRGARRETPKIKKKRTTVLLSRVQHISPLFFAVGPEEREDCYYPHGATSTHPPPSTRLCEGAAAKGWAEAGSPVVAASCQDGSPLLLFDSTTATAAAAAAATDVDSLGVSPSAYASPSPVSSFSAASVASLERHHHQQQQQERNTHAAFPDPLHKYIAVEETAEGRGRPPAVARYVDSREAMRFNSSQGTDTCGEAPHEGEPAIGDPAGPQRPRRRVYTSVIPLPPPPPPTLMVLGRDPAATRCRGGIYEGLGRFDGVEGGARSRQKEADPASCVTISTATTVCTLRRRAPPPRHHDGPTAARDTRRPPPRRAMTVPWTDAELVQYILLKQLFFSPRPASATSLGADKEARATTDVSGSRHTKVRFVLPTAEQPENDRVEEMEEMEEEVEEVDGFDDSDDASSATSSIRRGATTTAHGLRPKAKHRPSRGTSSCGSAARRRKDRRGRPLPSSSVGTSSPRAAGSSPSSAAMLSASPSSWLPLLYKSALQQQQQQQAGSTSSAASPSVSLCTLLTSCSIAAQAAAAAAAEQQQQQQQEEEEEGGERERQRQRQPPSPRRRFLHRAHVYIPHTCLHPPGRHAARGAGGDSLAASPPLSRRQLLQRSAALLFASAYHHPHVSRAAAAAAAIPPRSILKTAKRLQRWRLLRSCAPPSSVTPFSGLVAWRCALARAVMDTQQHEVEAVQASIAQQARVAAEGDLAVPSPPQGRQRRRMAPGNGADGAPTPLPGVLGHLHFLSVPVVSAALYLRHATALATHLAEDVGLLLLLAYANARQSQAPQSRRGTLDGSEKEELQTAGENNKEEEEDEEEEEEAAAVFSVLRVEHLMALAQCISRHVMAEALHPLLAHAQSTLPAAAAAGGGGGGAASPAGSTVLVPSSPQPALVLPSSLEGVSGHVLRYRRAVLRLWVQQLELTLPPRLAYGLRHFSQAYEGAVGRSLLFQRLQGLEASMLGCVPRLEGVVQACQEVAATTTATRASPPQEKEKEGDGVSTAPEGPLSAPDHPKTEEEVKGKEASAGPQQLLLHQALTPVGLAAAVAQWCTAFTAAVEPDGLAAMGHHPWWMGSYNNSSPSPPSHASPPLLGWEDQQWGRECHHTVDGDAPIPGGAAGESGGRGTASATTTALPGQQQHHVPSNEAVDEQREEDEGLQLPAGSPALHRPGAVAQGRSDTGEHVGAFVSPKAATARSLQQGGGRVVRSSLARAMSAESAGCDFLGAAQLGSYSVSSVPRGAGHRGQLLYPPPIHTCDPAATGNGGGGGSRRSSPRQGLEGAAPSSASTTMSTNGGPPSSGAMESGSCPPPPSHRYHQAPVRWRSALATFSAASPVPAVALSRQAAAEAHSHALRVFTAPFSSSFSLATPQASPGLLPCSPAGSPLPMFPGSGGGDSSRRSSGTQNQNPPNAPPPPHSGEREDAEELSSAGGAEASVQQRLRYFSSSGVQSGSGGGGLPRSVRLSWSCYRNSASHGFALPMFCALDGSYRPATDEEHLAAAEVAAQRQGQTSSSSSRRAKADEKARLPRQGGRRAARAAIQMHLDELQYASGHPRAAGADRRMAIDDDDEEEEEEDEEEVEHTSLPRFSSEVDSDSASEAGSEEEGEGDGKDGGDTAPTRMSLRSAKKTKKPKKKKKKEVEGKPNGAADGLVQERSGSPSTSVLPSRGGVSPLYLRRAPAHHRSTTQRHRGTRMKAASDLPAPAVMLFVSAPLQWGSLPPLPTTPTPRRAVSAPAGVVAVEDAAALPAQPHVPPSPSPSLQQQKQPPHHQQLFLVPVSSSSYWSEEDDGARDGAVRRCSSRAAPLTAKSTAIYPNSPCLAPDLPGCGTSTTAAAAAAAADVGFGVGATGAEHREEGTGLAAAEGAPCASPSMLMRCLAPLPTLAGVLSSSPVSQGQGLCSPSESVLPEEVPIYHHQQQQQRVGTRDTEAFSSPSLLAAQQSLLIPLLHAWFMPSLVRLITMHLDLYEHTYPVALFLEAEAVNAAAGVDRTIDSQQKGVSSTAEASLVDGGGGARRRSQAAPYSSSSSSKGAVRKHNGMRKLWRPAQQLGRERARRKRWRRENGEADVLRVGPTTSTMTTTTTSSSTSNKQTINNTAKKRGDKTICSVSCHGSSSSSSVSSSCSGGSSVVSSSSSQETAPRPPPPLALQQRRHTYSFARPSPPPPPEAAAAGSKRVPSFILSPPLLAQPSSPPRHDSTEAETVLGSASPADPSPSRTPRREGNKGSREAAPGGGDGDGRTVLSTRRRFSAGDVVGLPPATVAAGARDREDRGVGKGRHSKGEGHRHHHQRHHHHHINENNSQQQQQQPSSDTSLPCSASPPLRPLPIAAPQPLLLPASTALAASSPPPGQSPVTTFALHSPSSQSLVPSVPHPHQAQLNALLHSLQETCEQLKQVTLETYNNHHLHPRRCKLYDPPRSPDSRRSPVSRPQQAGDEHSGSGAGGEEEGGPGSATASSPRSLVNTSSTRRHPPPPVPPHQQQAQEGLCTPELPDDPREQNASPHNHAEAEAIEKATKETRGGGGEEEEAVAGTGDAPSSSTAQQKKLSIQREDEEHAAEEMEPVQQQQQSPPAPCHGEDEDDEDDDDRPAPAPASPECRRPGKTNRGSEVPASSPALSPQQEHRPSSRPPIRPPIPTRTSPPTLPASQQRHDSAGSSSSRAGSPRHPSPQPQQQQQPALKTNHSLSSGNSSTPRGVASPAPPSAPEAYQLVEKAMKLTTYALQLLGATAQEGKWAVRSPGVLGSNNNPTMSLSPIFPLASPVNANAGPGGLQPAHQHQRGAFPTIAGDSKAEVRSGASGSAFVAYLPPPPYPAASHCYAPGVSPPPWFSPPPALKQQPQSNSDQSNNNSGSSNIRNFLAATVNYQSANPKEGAGGGSGAPHSTDNGNPLVVVHPSQHQPNKSTMSSSGVTPFCLPHTATVIAPQNSFPAFVGSCSPTMGGSTGGGKHLREGSSGSGNDDEDGGGLQRQDRGTGGGGRATVPPFTAMAGAAWLPSRHGAKPVSPVHSLSQVWYDPTSVTPANETGLAPGRRNSSDAIHRASQMSRTGLGGCGGRSNPRHRRRASSVASMNPFASDSYHPFPLMLATNASQGMELMSLRSSFGIGGGPSPGAALTLGGPSFSSVAPPQQPSPLHVASAPAPGGQQSTALPAFAAVGASSVMATSVGGFQPAAAGAFNANNNSTAFSFFSGSAMPVAAPATAGPPQSGHSSGGSGGQPPSGQQCQHYHAQPSILGTSVHRKHHEMMHNTSSSQEQHQAPNAPRASGAVLYAVPTRGSGSPVANAPPVGGWPVPAAQRMAAPSAGGVGGGGGAGPRAVTSNRSASESGVLLDPSAGVFEMHSGGSAAVSPSSIAQLQLAASPPSRAALGLTPISPSNSHKAQQPSEVAHQHPSAHLLSDATPVANVSSPFPPQAASQVDPLHMASVAQQHVAAGQQPALYLDSELTVVPRDPSMPFFQYASLNPSNSFSETSSGAGAGAGTIRTTTGERTIDPSGLHKHTSSDKSAGDAGGALSAAGQQQQQPPRQASPFSGGGGSSGTSLPPRLPSPASDGSGHPNNTTTTTRSPAVPLTIAVEAPPEEGEGGDGGGRGRGKASRTESPGGGGAPPSRQQLSIQTRYDVSACPSTVDSLCPTPTKALNPVAPFPTGAASGSARHSPPQVQPPGTPPATTTSTTTVDLSIAHTAGPPLYQATAAGLLIPTSALNTPMSAKPPTTVASAAADPGGAAAISAWAAASSASGPSFPPPLRPRAVPGSGSGSSGSPSTPLPPSSGAVISLLQGESAMVAAAVEAQLEQVQRQFFAQQQAYQTEMQRQLREKECHIADLQATLEQVLIEMAAIRSAAAPVPGPSSSLQQISRQLLDPSPPHGQSSSHIPLPLSSVQSQDSSQVVKNLQIFSVSASSPLLPSPPSTPPIPGSQAQGEKNSDPPHHQHPVHHMQERESGRAVDHPITSGGGVERTRQRHKVGGHKGAAMGGGSGGGGGGDDGSDDGEGKRTGPGQGNKRVSSSTSTSTSRSHSSSSLSLFDYGYRVPPSSPQMLERNGQQAVGYPPFDADVVPAAAGEAEPSRRRQHRPPALTSTSHGGVEEGSHLHSPAAARYYRRSPQKHRPAQQQSHGHAAAVSGSPFAFHIALGPGHPFWAGSTSPSPSPAPSSSASCSQQHQMSIPEEGGGGGDSNTIHNNTSRCAPPSTSLGGEPQRTAVACTGEGSRHRVNGYGTMRRTRADVDGSGVRCVERDPFKLHHGGSTGRGEQLSPHFVFSSPSLEMVALSRSGGAGGTQRSRSTTEVEGTPSRHQTEPRSASATATATAYSTSSAHHRHRHSSNPHAQPLPPHHSMAFTPTSWNPNAIGGASLPSHPQRGSSLQASNDMYAAAMMSLSSITIAAAANPNGIGSPGVAGGGFTPVSFMARTGSHTATPAAGHGEMIGGGSSSAFFPPHRSGATSHRHQLHPPAPATPSAPPITGAVTSPALTSPQQQHHQNFLRSTVQQYLHVQAQISSTSIAAASSSDTSCTTATTSQQQSTASHPIQQQQPLVCGNPQGTLLIPGISTTSCSAGARQCQPVQMVDKATSTATTLVALPHRPQQDDSNPNAIANDDREVVTTTAIEAICAALPSIDTAEEAVGMTGEAVVQSIHGGGGEEGGRGEGEVEVEVLASTDRPATAPPPPPPTELENRENRVGLDLVHGSPCSSEPTTSTSTIAAAAAALGATGSSGGGLHDGRLLPPPAAADGSASAASLSPDPTLQRSSSREEEEEEGSGPADTCIATREPLPLVAARYATLPPPPPAAALTLSRRFTLQCRGEAEEEQPQQPVQQGGGGGGGGGEGGRSPPAGGVSPMNQEKTCSAAARRVTVGWSPPPPDSLQEAVVVVVQGQQPRSSGSSSPPVRMDLGGSPTSLHHLVDSTPEDKGNLNATATTAHTESSRSRSRSAPSRVLLRSSLSRYRHRRLSSHHGPFASSRRPAASVANRSPSSSPVGPAHSYRRSVARAASAPTSVSPTPEEIDVQFLQSQHMFQLQAMLTRAHSERHLLHNKLRRSRQRQGRQQQQQQRRVVEAQVAAREQRQQVECLAQDVEMLQRRLQREEQRRRAAEETLAALLQRGPGEEADCYGSGRGPVAAVSPLLEPPLLLTTQAAGREKDERDPSATPGGKKKATLGDPATASSANTTPAHQSEAAQKEFSSHSTPEDDEEQGEQGEGAEGACHVSAGVAHEKSKQQQQEEKEKEEEGRAGSGGMALPTGMTAAPPSPFATAVMTERADGTVDSVLFFPSDRSETTTGRRSSNSGVGGRPSLSLPPRSATPLRHATATHERGAGSDGIVGPSEEATSTSEDGGGAELKEEADFISFSALAQRAAQLQLREAALEAKMASCELEVESVQSDLAREAERRHAAEEALERLQAELREMQQRAQETAHQRTNTRSTEAADAAVQIGASLPAGVVSSERQGGVNGACLPFPPEQKEEGAAGEEEKEEEEEHIKNTPVSVAYAPSTPLPGHGQRQEPPHLHAEGEGEDSSREGGGAPPSGRSTDQRQSSGTPPSLEHQQEQQPVAPSTTPRGPAPPSSSASMPLVSLDVLQHAEAAAYQRGREEEHAAVRRLLHEAEEALLELRSAHQREVSATLEAVTQEYEAKISNLAVEQRRARETAEKEADRLRRRLKKAKNAAEAAAQANRSEAFPSGVQQPPQPQLAPRQDRWLVVDDALALEAELELVTEERDRLRRKVRALQQQQQQQDRSQLLLSALSLSSSFVEEGAGGERYSSEASSVRYRSVQREKAYGPVYEKSDHKHRTRKDQRGAAKERPKKDRYQESTGRKHKTSDVCSDDRPSTHHQQQQQQQEEEGGGGGGVFAAAALPSSILRSIPPPTPLFAPTRGLGSTWMGAAATGRAEECGAAGPASSFTVPGGPGGGRSAADRWPPPPTLVVPPPPPPPSLAHGREGISRYHPAFLEASGVLDADSPSPIEYKPSPLSVISFLLLAVNQQSGADTAIAVMPLFPSGSLLRSGAAAASEKTAAAAAAAASLPVSPATSARARQLLQASIHDHLLQGPKFAVVYCGNHQYKVTPGDIILVQRLRAEIGSRIRLRKVLMVAGERFTAVGRPLLENAVVTADVEEQKRMRNVVSLFATPGRRRVRWVDAPHAATVLRVRSITYTPEVVGELDKYDGALLDLYRRGAASGSPSEAPAQLTAEEEKALRTTVLDTVPNPVYKRLTGFHIFEKSSTAQVEAAQHIPQSVLGPMEELMMTTTQQPPENDAAQGREEE